MNPATLAIIGSIVTLGPAENPKADAAVTFFNHESNSSHDERDYNMIWNGIEITATFSFNVDPIGSDQITVTPPHGWTCAPADCTVTLIEGATGTVELFAWMGM